MKRRGKIEVMTTQSNALSYVTDQMQRGLMTADQANVEMVLMMGIRVVKGSLPKAVRVALNAAVKTGTLGRLPKKGLLPEVYFNVSSRANAIDEQRRIARESIDSISRICVGESI